MIITIRLGVLLCPHRKSLQMRVKWECTANRGSRLPIRVCLLCSTQLRRRRWLVAIRPLPATSDKNHRIYIENSNSLTHYYTLLKNTAIEHSERLLTIEKCYQSDEETWPDQKQLKILTYLHTYPPTYLPTNLPPSENNYSDKKTWTDPT